MRSTSRTRMAGSWASWADCSPMIEARHPEVAKSQRLPKVIAGGSPARAQFHTVWRACAVSKFPIGGHWLPVWVILATGWQHEASSRIELEHRETLFRVMAKPGRALLTFQGCAGAGAPLQTCPTCPLTRIDPALFRVLPVVSSRWKGFVAKPKVQKRVQCFLGRKMVQRRP